MGWDIYTIGKHNLSFKDIASLAQELHQRLHIDIEYGYDVMWRYNERMNILFFEESHECKLGICGSSSTVPHFKLTPAVGYDAYLLKNYFDEHRVIPQFKHPEEEECFKYDIKYFDPNVYTIYNTSINKDGFDILDIQIYPECVHIGILMPFRWFGFIECVENNDPFSLEMKDLMEMRRVLKTFYNALGCEKIFFHADQGPAAFIMDSYTKSWQELEDVVVLGSYYDDAINSDCRIGQKPYDKPKVSIVNLPQLLQSGSSKELEQTVVLVDDFSDLQ